MIYTVVDVFPVGKNTSVTVSGNGQGLQNGISITTPDGKKFTLLSMALLSGQSVDDVQKNTTFLVEGKFSADQFTV